MAAIRNNTDTDILKSPIPGHDFVELTAYDRLLKFNDFCWIGHNRYGTVGKNTKLNAHPFAVNKDDGTCLLVGAHNGTLKNRHVLNDYDKFGTDSEALFNQIAHEGIEETIPKVEGAWALTWYDHDEEELRFLRNKERSLFYAYEEEKKTLIWASELWMIRVATSRAGMKLHEDKVYSVAEDTLYKFPVPVKINDELYHTAKGGLVGKTPAFFQEWDKERWTGGTRETHTAPQRKEFQNDSSRASTGAGTQINPNQNIPSLLLNSPSSTQAQSSGDSQTNERLNSSENQSNVHDISSASKFKGFNGKRLTKKEIEDQLAGGCSWCELEFIDLKDRFAWLAPSQPVCEKCLKGRQEPEQEREERLKLKNSNVVVH